MGQQHIQNMSGKTLVIRAGALDQRNGFGQHAAVAGYHTVNMGLYFQCHGYRFSSWLIT
jgi:hypothetical protein